MERPGSCLSALTFISALLCTLLSQTAMRSLEHSLICHSGVASSDGCVFVSHRQLLQGCLILRYEVWCPRCCVPARGRGFGGINRWSELEGCHAPLILECTALHPQLGMRSEQTEPHTGTGNKRKPGFGCKRPLACCSL